MELNSPFLHESHYESLLRGLAELKDIGHRKVALDLKQLTKSRAALQSHLQNHKVEHSHYSMFQIQTTMFSVVACPSDTLSSSHSFY